MILHETKFPPTTEIFRQYLSMDAGSDRYESSVTSLLPIAGWPETSACACESGSDYIHAHECGQNS